MHVIQQTNNLLLPPGTLAVTCDVESLYSNIRHKDGIRAIQYFLDKETGDPLHNAVLVSLLDFVLNNNYFIFDRVFY